MSQPGQLVRSAAKEIRFSIEIVRENSAHATIAPSGTKNVRRREHVLDSTDRAILRLLNDDARLSNSALAEKVGIAPSTCLMRVRRLQEDGVITGFRAEIAPDAIGRSLQAFVLIRLHPTARDALAGFARKLAEMPGSLGVAFVGGTHDFQVHVAVRSSDDLRDLVTGISALTEVANTETTIIFDYLPGAGLKL